MRLVRWQTGADVRLRQQLQMLRQLFPDAIVVSAPEEGSDQALSKSSQGLHAKSSASTAMNRSIRAVVWAHACASTRSRRRPAVVSRENAARRFVSDWHQQ